MRTQLKSPDHKIVQRSNYLINYINRDHPNTIKLQNSRQKIIYMSPNGFRQQRKSPNYFLKSRSPTSQLITINYISTQPSSQAQGTIMKNIQPKNQLKIPVGPLISEPAKTHNSTFIQQNKKYQKSELITMNKCEKNEKQEYKTNASNIPEIVKEQVEGNHYDYKNQVNQINNYQQNIQRKFKQVPIKLNSKIYNKYKQIKNFNPNIPIIKTSHFQDTSRQHFSSSKSIFPNVPNSREIEIYYDSYDPRPFYSSQSIKFQK